MSILRHLETEDYYPIVRVANDWWGGRPVAGILLRILFDHFRPTSFVLEQDGIIQGFLIGFQSQTNPAQAYIHAVGTHPDYRGQSIGRRLYDHFFAVVRQLGCTEALSITTPINKGSIAFHRQMGFEILPGDAETDGVAVTTNYDGRGGARVLFRRRLDDAPDQKQDTEIRKPSATERDAESGR
jgi:GNAT superfamily N-acetyltransferase